MPSSRLFGPMFTTPAMAEAVSDGAWLQAMLDVEAALARAQASFGLIPPEAAEEIAAACVAERFDVGAIGEAARSPATPVVPLVEALRRAVSPSGAGFVHRGATSQDILDTAMMLVARGALELVLADLGSVAEACAALAGRHRGTVMAGRTLMQQAVPITFGLKAAGWLTGVVEATATLRRVRDERLALQFGGAAGTLGSFGERGLDVGEAMGRELGLQVPPMPWHTQRGRIIEMAAALAGAASAVGKIAVDVLLMAQTEIGEVSEGAGGRSSAMPHKRNPAGTVSVRACVEQAQGFAAMLLTASPHENERAAGAWQAEWTSVSALFEAVGGAVARTAEVLSGLEVYPERMRANLDASLGLFAAEPLLGALSARLGDAEARRLVDDVVGSARTSGMTLGDVAAAHEHVSAALPPEELERICDPGTQVGMAGALIDRALSAYREMRR